jgi:hypothetical protein
MPSGRLIQQYGEFAEDGSAERRFDNGPAVRRRHQPRRAPHAKMRPGNPAPAMGMGTGAGVGSFAFRFARCS